MTNWSVILNVLLLVGVTFAMFRLIQIKKGMMSVRRRKHVIPPQVNEPPLDDIISIRRIDVPEESSEAPDVSYKAIHREKVAEPLPPEAPVEEVAPQMLHMFLLAKEDRTLAGYELLQTILAEGLRIGEDQLFHRHQHKNGQGPVICSLATATNDGTFDLQNIGGFSVHGLCLFMEASGSINIDAERLNIMVDTATRLAEGLDAHLLDDARQTWSDTSFSRYQRLLNVTECLAETD